MMVLYTSVLPFSETTQRGQTSDSPDYFSVCVQEFSQALDVTNFVLYDGGECVIWKWKWGENVFQAPDRQHFQYAKAK